MAKGTGSVSRSSSQPWEAQQPYLKGTYGTAKELGKQPLEYYPGSTVAGQSPETLAAQQMVAQRAGEGNPLLGQAQDYTSSVLAGDYLNANPHREAMFNQGADLISQQYMGAVAPGIDTQYAGSNRMGGGLHGRSQGLGRQELGQSLSDLWTRVGYADYAQERGYQEGAATQAPGLAREDYYDMGQLGQVGEQRDVYLQRLLDDMVGRFEFEQNEPWQRAAMESNLYGAPVMTSQATSKPVTGTLDWISGLGGSI